MGAGVSGAVRPRYHRGDGVRHAARGGADDLCLQAAAARRTPSAARVRSLEPRLRIGPHLSDRRHWRAVRAVGRRAMTDTADVVVVGGGVIGVSIAFALASAGVQHVTLLEQGALASGASGRSSALIRMHYVNAEDARLAWASFPVFRDWPERMGGPPVFTHTGFLAVVGHQDAAALRANVEML